MSFAASLSAMLLAGVFVVAAIAKLLDRAGTRETLAEFGVPARAAAPGAVALPLLELAIAVALIPAATAVPGAVAGARDAPRLHRGHRGHARARRGTGLQLLRRAEPDGGRPRHARPQRPPRRDRGVRRRRGHGRRDRVVFRDAVADDRGWVIAIVALAALVLGLAWFCWQLLRQNGRLLLRLDAQTSELGGRGDLRSRPRGRGDRARLRPREPRRAADLARGAARAGPAGRAGLHRSGLRRLPAGRSSTPRASSATAS